jgi:hypothetical protein
MKNELEYRVNRLEKIINESDFTYLEDSANLACDYLIYIEDILDKIDYNSLKDMYTKSKYIGNQELSNALFRFAQCWIAAKQAVSKL